MCFSAGWGTKEAENVFLTRGWEFGFECAWGLQVTWHFRVAFPYWLLHGWLSMVPSCVWKMNFENLLGLQFLQNPQYQCSLFQSFSSLSICSSLCICSVITYLYLLFMFGAVISLFYSVGWRFHSRRGGVLPYMGYIAMCRCEGYGFQAVYSGTGHINQRLEVGWRL